MIRLELPHIKYKDTYLDAVREFHRLGSENISTDHYFRQTTEELEQSFDSFVQEYENKRIAVATKDRVPGTQFWIIDENDEYCGRVSLRHSLTEELSKHGGHIGYDIRPSKRGKSYASIALGLCLKEAKKLGLEKVLLTCDDDNFASMKSIEKNGGILQDKFTQDSGKVTRRYWIELK